MGDSDSENEGSQTNVSRLVIRPPGHTGKAQRGHLAFEATCESANLGRVDFVSDTEYDVYIRPDTCNPRHRFWFYFSVDNTQANQRIIFNIVNISKSRNLLMNGLTPVVKSTSRPRWQRMPTSHVFYHRSPAHEGSYVLSFAFCFDKENELYQFAMCQPFTYSRHKLCLEKLLSRQYNYVYSESLGKSVFEKPIDLITISNPENLKDFKHIDEDIDSKKIKVIFIMARVHPGETPASFVIQGLLDFLVSSHDIAASLRDFVVFKIIPMLNPDGVFLGNQRCNLVGQDLNRAWADTNKFMHSEIVDIKKKLQHYDNHSAYDLDMVLDIHAHTALTGLFVYGNSYDDVYRYERHIVFPKILAQNCDDFNLANTIYNADMKKSGSARRHMTTMLSHEVNTYTIEVSLLGFEDKEKRQIIPYTDELYAKIGRNITRALWDYYKIVGTIPLEESSDEESGIPKPSSKLDIFRNFNMDRLREVERQRKETAQTFEETEKDKKISCASSQIKMKNAKKKDFVRINSEKFRKSVSISDVEDLDLLSNISMRNDGTSSGENDYSDFSGRHSDKVLTPIVSLEMDDPSFNSHMKLGQKTTSAGDGDDDDVDFFFNSNNQNIKRTLYRQDSVDGPGDRRSRAMRTKHESSQNKQYFSSPLSSLHISKLGAPPDADAEKMISQTLAKSSLGLDDLQLNGFTGFSRKVGGGGKLSQLGPAPLPQSLSPHLPLSSLSLEATQAPSNSLSVLDFSQITKQPPGARTGLQKRRKKTIAIPKGLTKEEYFSKLENF